MIRWTTPVSRKRIITYHTERSDNKVRKGDRVEVVSVHDMKAYRCNRGIAPLFITFGQLHVPAALPHLKASLVPARPQSPLELFAEENIFHRECDPVLPPSSLRTIASVFSRPSPKLFVLFFTHLWKSDCEAPENVPLSSPFAYYQLSRHNRL